MVHPWDTKGGQPPEGDSRNGVNFGVNPCMQWPQCSRACTDYPFGLTTGGMWDGDMADSGIDLKDAKAWTPANEPFPAPWSIYPGFGIQTSSFGPHYPNTYPGMYPGPYCPGAIR